MSKWPRQIMMSPNMARFTKVIFFLFLLGKAFILSTITQNMFTVWIEEKNISENIQTSNFGHNLIAGA